MNPRSQEYIITDLLLKRITVIMYQDCEPDVDIVDSLIAEVHARPHTPAPALEQGVIKAAMNWWIMQRPLDWSEEQHLEHPTVNIFGNHERELAKAVSESLRQQAGERDE